MWSKLQTVSSSILPKKLIRKLEGIVNQNEDVTGKPEIENKTKSKEAPTQSHIEGSKPGTPLINIDIIPEKDDSYKEPEEVPGEPGDDELNYRDLMEYLNEKLVNDLSGKEKLMNAKDIIYAFCKLENFSMRFTQLRAMIDSGTVKWPGGFAVGEMRKMLDPGYTPNIR